MLNRFSKSVVSALFALALIFCVSAYAQNASEHKVSFFLDGKVGNEVVKKGTYTVVIPEAEQGTVEIKMGKKVVTAQFTKKQNTAEADADKLTYQQNEDGTRSVATITPRGRKYTLVLQENGTSVAKGEK